MGRAVENTSGQAHLEALEDELNEIWEPLAPMVDPRRAALAALVAADFLSQRDRIARLGNLANSGAYDLANVERTRAVARALLFLTEQLHGPWIPGRTGSLDAPLMQDAAVLRARMIESVELVADALDEVQLWLRAIGIVQTPADLVFDLRILAHLYRTCLETAPDKLDPEEERRALGLAAELQGFLCRGDSPSQARARDAIARAWTLFVPAYTELCRAGHFVCGDRERIPSVPTLSAIARAERRRRALPPEERERLSSPELPLPAPAFPPPIPPFAAGEAGLEPSDFALVDDREIESLPPSADPAAMKAHSARPPVKRDSIRPAESAHPTSSARPDSRREEARTFVALEVSIGTESNFYMGFTENLSTGGVFIATYQPIPIGEKVRVELSLFEDTRVLVDGQVRWVREHSDTSELWPGIGVQFDELPADVESIIQKFLELREPLFFDI